MGTDTYYKLDPTYSKWKDLNGLTISLTTGLVEYDGNFTLDIANGADMVSPTMYDANGDATRDYYAERWQNNCAIDQGRNNPMD